MAHSYTARTHNVEVAVVPTYLQDESSPESGRFVWAYTVSISNRRPHTIQLISRYWRITNALGKIEEVRGDGVIGKQPFLRPGSTFRYTSGCPLSTSSGIMAGHYLMHDQNGDEFTVEIPAFSLDLPNSSHALN
jgi:ApaG protein